MGEKKRDAFVFYRSFYEAMQNLSAEDRLIVYESIFAYALDNEEMSLSGVPAAIFMLVKPTLDASRKKSSSGKAGGEANAKQDESKPEANPKQTESKTEANAKQDESKPEANPKQTESNKIKDKGQGIKDKRQGIKDKGQESVYIGVSSETDTPARTLPKNWFSPPTVEEVREYCKERGNHIDPERFVDYYTARGWTIGKTPMIDWKATVRSWEKITPPHDGNASDHAEIAGYGDGDEFFKAATKAGMMTEDGV